MKPTARQTALVVTILVAILAIVVLLVAWPTERGERPIVGVILATTGGADFIGKPEDAVLRALDHQLRAEGNIEAPFDLRIVDSGGNPDAARALFQQFASNPRTLAIIGPSTSGESVALAPLADAAEIPLLSLAASKDIVLSTDAAGNTTTRPWVFKFAQNDDLAADRLVRAMISMGTHRAHVLLSSCIALEQSPGRQARPSTFTKGPSVSVTTRSLGIRLTSSIALRDLNIAKLTENQQPAFVARSSSRTVPENQWRMTVPGKSSPMAAMTSDAERRECTVSTLSFCSAQRARICEKTSRCRRRSR